MSVVDFWSLLLPRNRAIYNKMHEVVDSAPVGVRFTLAQKWASTKKFFGIGLSKKQLDAAERRINQKINQNPLF